MKILHTVGFYSPSTGGSQEVVKQISERLVKKGHEVTVATARLPERRSFEENGVVIKDFDIRGTMAHGYTGRTDDYRDFVRKGDFDIMMNYAAQIWTTDLVLPMLDQLPMKKVFVPCGFSGLYSPEYSNYFKDMPRWMRSYDGCVYLSKCYRDTVFARENGLDNSYLIPNGASETEFGRRPARDIRKALGIPENNYLIVLVGSHTGLKGHREAIDIFSRADLRDSTLLIIANNVRHGCGKSCSYRSLRSNLNLRSLSSGKRVVVTPLSREDTIAAYFSADLFLLPSNVECSPLVLFEAMAAGVPFLSSEVGNSREIAEWSGGGEILPTNVDEKGYSHVIIPDSVKKLESCYRDRERWKRIGLEGQRSWRDHFTWEKIADQYEALYSSLLSGEPRSPNSLPRPY